tara:strand:- start:1928 stop:2275 length:348 start_codon:yes stop_codon:yes gene_type:complete
MLFKSLFLLVFANLFNQAYQLQQIKCPKWVPGTNQILPQGVTLSPELELKNRVRCYCKVVKEKERQCIAQHVPASICKARTAQWVEDNLKLKESFQLVNGVSPLPRRDRMMNVEP